MGWPYFFSIAGKYDPRFGFFSATSEGYSLPIAFDNNKTRYFLDSPLLITRV
jgi:hypothetical protein